VTTTIALYVVYALAMYFLTPRSVAISATRVDALHPASHEIPAFIVLETCGKPLLVFTVVALPIMAGLIKFFRR